jgi:predicted dienelactone hydrolase
MTPTQRKLGYKVVSTLDAERRRPILIDIWYPAAANVEEREHDYGLARGSAALDAEPELGPHPAVLLSHGAFGAARNYSWLAEHLARQGHCVVGVSHYGESYVYGAETIDPGAAARPWLRPLDCSRALDYVLDQSELGGTIDRARVGAVGHSSGGNTVIALAGAVFDPDAMAQYCASNAASADRGCRYGAASTHVGASEARADHRDARVHAVVALDPALGPGYSAGALARVSVPVCVIGAVDNDFLPFEHHAAHYARFIPRAELTRLEQGEGHFVFVDECRADIDVQGIQLGRDREGVSRARVHEALKARVSDFLARHL